MRYVLDASVVLSWAFEDESNEKQHPWKIESGSHWTSVSYLLSGLVKC